MSTNSKTVDTVPEGVWEASHTNKSARNCRKSSASASVTDAQGNGYPQQNHSSSDCSSNSSDCHNS